MPKYVVELTYRPEILSTSFIVEAESADAVREILEKDGKSFVNAPPVVDGEGWVEKFCEWGVAERSKLVIDSIETGEVLLVRTVNGTDVDPKIQEFFNKRMKKNGGDSVPARRSPNPDSVEWILHRIFQLNEMVALNSNYGHGYLPTHRNIWRGSYDVWSSEQDMIDAVEIPKSRMKQAEEAGLIYREKMNWKNYEVEVWRLTDSGMKLIASN